MKEMKFVLTASDIETINDALTEQDQDINLIMMFSLLETQDNDVVIKVKNKNAEKVHSFLNLIEDLGLELDEDEEECCDCSCDAGKCNCDCFVSNTIDDETLRVKPEEIKSSLKSMREEEFFDAIENKTTPVRVSASFADGGWDTRVPKPSVDESLMEVKNIPIDNPFDNAAKEIMDEVLDEDDYITDEEVMEENFGDSISRFSDDQPMTHELHEEDYQEKSDVSRSSAWNANTWHTEM